MTRSDHPGADSPQSPERLPVPASVPGSGAVAPSTGRVIPASALPPGLSAAPNPSLLFRALQRRWLLALFLGLVAGLGAAAAVWFLVPLKYPVQAVVKVTPRPPSVLTDDKNLVTIDPATFQKTMAATARHPSVLLRALKSALSKDAGHLAGKPVSNLPIVREQPDPIAWLEKRLKIEFKDSPELMQITLAHSRPDMAKPLVEAVANAFIEEIGDEDKLLRKGRLGAIDTRLNGIKGLNGLRTELQGLREQYHRALMSNESKGPITKNGKSDPVDEGRLTALQLELLNAEKELDKLNAAAIAEDRLNAETDLSPGTNAGSRLPQQANEEAIKAKVEAVLDADPFVRQQESRIATVQAKLETNRALYNDGSTAPQLRKLTNELEDAKKALATYKAQKTPAIKQQLVDQDRALQKARLAELGNWKKTQGAALTHWRSKLEESIAQARKNLHEQEIAKLPLRRLKEELDNAEAFAQLLTDAWQKLDLERFAPPRALLRGEAEVKTEEAELKHLLLAGGAGSAGFVLVLLGVSLWEFRRRRVTTSDDVVQGLGWRLIGALPALPARTRGLGRGGDKDKYWRSLLTESVDATRTTLLHAARTEGVRTVMVTSAVAGEGKTSLSCHLATSLARAGRKTLLIDCDLRSPAVHRLFDLSAQPGLSELLRGEAELSDVIRATPAANLWLIPAGQCDPQTLQALAQDALAPILDQLKAQFDFVLIDSSPVLPIVDALVISQHVDVVIFSLLRDVSRIPNVYAAYQRLAALGVRMLGAVVNGVDQDTYGYSKYYANKPAR